MPKRKTKKGGKKALNMKEARRGEIKEQVYTQPAAQIPLPPFMPPILPPLTQHEIIINQRAQLRDAIDEVKNHDYYVYQPPRVPTAMNLEVGKEDIAMPPTRRPARKGDHKYIGRENIARGGPPNSQRALARKFGMDNNALIDLNQGVNKIQELKWYHLQLMHDERTLPNNQKTAKMGNGFRLYRDSPNDAWKSLGNYDFKNRDSGLHGTFKPHPQGVERVFGRGGKRRRKTKRKRRKKTRKHKRRKRRKTRKR
jgi:hypothetical protein